MMLFRRFFPVVSFLIALVISIPVSAQIEEIVVTAQKRSESVQDVPITVNVLTGDQLDAMAVRTTEDIIKVFSGITKQTSSAVNAGLTIRGVGTSNFHITGQQAVGEYMDGVSLISPFTSSLGLFDMERIEVLRGPQNTLFGRNTTGGAVNYITRKPVVGGETNGFGRLRVGNEGRVDFEGALEFPMGEAFSARVAVSSQNRDSVWNNLVENDNGSEPGEIDRKSLRLLLKWEPSEETGVLLNIHTNRDRGTRTPQKGHGMWDANGVQPVNVAGGGVLPLATALSSGAAILGPVHDCPARFDGTADYNGISNCVSWIPRTPAGLTNPSTADWNDVYDHGSMKADIDFDGVNLTIDHDFGSVALTSITSYDEISLDFGGTNNSTVEGFGFYPGQSGTWEVFSQELRLTSTADSALRWIAGGYYSKEDDRLATIINRTDNTSPPFGLVPSITVDQDVTILSAYGQLEYDVSDNGTLTFGARYTDDDKSGISTARVAAFNESGRPGGAPTFPLNQYIDLAHFDEITDPPSGVCPPPVGGFPCSLDIDVEQKLQEWGYKLGYDHQFNDTVMGYASISRGFKSGAFDTRALAAFAGTADEPVEPEFLDAFEVGFKSTVLDGTMEFNGALFYYLWEDRQQFDVDDLGRPAFLNIPEAEITGFDLEMKWVPAENWYISGGLTYLDSEVTDSGTLLTVVEGAQMPNTPKWSLAGLAQYDIPMGDNNLRLQANIRWNDEQYSGTAGNPEQLRESTLYLNARASYYFGTEQQYEFALWAENITAEKACGTDGTLDTLNYQFTCVPNPGMAFYGATFVVDF